MSAHYRLEFGKTRGHGACGACFALEVHTLWILAKGDLALGFGRGQGRPAPMLETFRQVPFFLYRHREGKSRVWSLAASALVLILWIIPVWGM